MPTQEYPGGRRFRDRPTADLVIFFLTGLVGFVIVASTIGVIVAEAINPEIDTGLIVARIVGIVNSLTGAIIGYVAGRGVRSDISERRARRAREGKEGGV